MIRKVFIFILIILGSLVCSSSYAMSVAEFKNIAFNYRKNNSNFSDEAIIQNINESFPNGLSYYLNDGYNILFCGGSSSLDCYIMPLNYSNKLWIRQGYSGLYGIYCYARAHVSKGNGEDSISFVEFNDLTIQNLVEFNESLYKTPFDIYKGRSEAGATLWASAGSYSPSYMTINGPFEDEPETYFFVDLGQYLNSGYGVTNQNIVSGDNFFLVNNSPDNLINIFTLSQVTQLDVFNRKVYYYNIYHGQWEYSRGESTTIQNFVADVNTSNVTINLENDLFSYYESKPNVDRFIIYELIPLNTNEYDNIIIPVYFKTQFTHLIGSSVNSSDTFSGDYLDIVNNDNNTQDVIGYLSESDPDGVMASFISGENIDSLSNQFGVLSLDELGWENPISNFLFNVVESVYDTLVVRSNVLLDFSHHYQDGWYIDTDEFILPDGALKTLLFYMMTFLYVFGNYKFYHYLFSLLQEAKIDRLASILGHDEFYDSDIM